MPRCSRALSLSPLAFVCGLLAACGESTHQPLQPFPTPVLTMDGAAAVPSDGATGSAIPGGDAGTSPATSGTDLGRPDAASGPGTSGTSGMMQASDSGSLPSTNDAGLNAGLSNKDAGPNDKDAGTGTTGQGVDAGRVDSGPAPAACTGAPLSVGDHTYTIDSKNGQKYAYILRVPAGVDPLQRAPVIVHWHALSSDPEEARKVTSIDAKGDAAKALLVFPRSPDKSWDVGACCTSTVGGVSRDEEVFARELIKDVVAKACVDERRIYSNGFSNGGMISQMLACKMSDVFAAVAPLGSTLTIPTTDCKPARPIPIFMLNGTADPLVGYDSPGTSGGISVPDDVKFWVGKNGCTGEPETYLTKGKVKCIRYTHCSAGVEVAHCAVDGMGHCVPGMKTESATNCMTKVAFGLIPIQLGMPNNDIDALQMDVDFLLRFTLP